MELLIFFGIPAVVILAIYLGVGLIDFRGDAIRAAWSHYYSGKFALEDGDMNEFDRHRQKSIECLERANMWPWWPVIQWQESKAARTKDRADMAEFLGR